MTETPTQPPDVGGVKARLVAMRDANVIGTWSETARDALAVIEALERNLKVSHAQNLAWEMTPASTNALRFSAEEREALERASEDATDPRVAARIRALLSKEG